MGVLATPAGKSITTSQKGISELTTGSEDFGFEKRKVSERADKSIHLRSARHPKIEGKSEVPFSSELAQSI